MRCRVGRGQGEGRAANQKKRIVRARDLLGLRVTHARPCGDRRLFTDTAFSMPRTTTSARHRHETLSERLRGGARGAGVVALSLCNIGASPLIDAQCRTAGVVLLLAMADDGTRHHHEAFT